VTFDVFSSGGGGTDSAVDALSAAVSSITNWSDVFESTEPLSFTMPTASDTDGDGLPDTWENAHFGNLTQGFAGDPDGDQLENGSEFGRSTNPNKADTDDDGLSDKVEDNSGVYGGIASPGTNPVNGDTDNDTRLDGAEAAGTALGFESNPLVKNFAVFAVPGNFNSWDPTGSALPANAMSSVGTSLLTQYQWKLDYLFTASGQAIQFKFAGGSWSDNWGGTTGTGVPNGPDITASITASGIHRFTFDQISLAYTFSRPEFPNVDAFLAAYDLAADANGDPDGDDLSNAAEFPGNSDPMNPDTDGDTLIDGGDPTPLRAAVYDLWISASGATVANFARTADPDQDGLSNIEEFLFGGSPTAGSNMPGGILSVAAGVLPTGPVAIVRWIGRATDLEATYRIESTTTFQPGWSAVDVAPVAAADQNGVAPGYTRFEAAVPVAGPQIFLRVEGTEL
jgi:hypothetical protein